MTFSDLASVPCDPLAPFTDQLRLAAAAYLARFKGSSREHTESDLRCYGLTSWEFRPLVETHGSIAWKLLQAMSKTYQSPA